MPHFVPDHHADGAVVYGIVGVHVEERSLQDAGRERDRVARRRVVSVDSRGRHGPLGAI